MCTYWEGQLHLEGGARSKMEAYVVCAIPMMDPGLYVLCGDDERTTNVVSGITGTAMDAMELFSFGDCLRLFRSSG